MASNISKMAAMLINKYNMNVEQTAFLIEDLIPKSVGQLAVKKKDNIFLISLGGDFDRIDYCSIIENGLTCSSKISSMTPDEWINLPNAYLELIIK